MESRKMFIARMHLMMQEIKQSHLDDDNIIPMLEYQLQRREIELLEDTKTQVNLKMQKMVATECTGRWVAKKGMEKFLDIIDSL
jgi:hypothetical protein